VRVRPRNARGTPRGAAVRPSCVLAGRLPRVGRRTCPTYGHRARRGSPRPAGAGRSPLAPHVACMRRPRCRLAGRVHCRLTRRAPFAAHVHDGRGGGHGPLPTARSISPPIRAAHTGAGFDVTSAARGSCSGPPNARFPADGVPRSRLGSRRFATSPGRRAAGHARRRCLHLAAAGWSVATLPVAAAARRGRPGAVPTSQSG
jgi:hypothetical protein